MGSETFKKPDTIIEDKSENCPFCGKTNTYSKEDYFIKE